MAKKYVGIKALKVVCEYLKSVFVRKVNGKGLSSNDFTDDFKRKIEGIEESATKNPLAPRLFVSTCNTTGASDNKKLLTTSEQNLNLKESRGFVEGDTIVVKFGSTNSSARPQIVIKLGDENLTYPIYFAGKNTSSAALTEDERKIAGGTANMYCSYVCVPDSGGNKIFVWTSISEQSPSQSFQEGTVSELNDSPVNTAKLWSSQVLSSWIQGKQYNKVFKTDAILKTVESENHFCLKLHEESLFELQFGNEILVNVGSENDLRGKFSDVFKTYFIFCKNDGEVIESLESHKFLFRYDGKVTNEPSGIDPFSDDDKTKMFPADKYSRFIYLGDDVWMWIGHEYTDSSSVDISGKADKVQGQNLSNRLAKLTAGGNLASSGKTVDDFLWVGVQSLTNAQKAQVRANIGAGTSSSDTDTKDTAGATEGGKRDVLYLVGAKKQETFQQTYTRKSCYISADGRLYSGGKQVLTELPNHNHDNRYFIRNGVIRIGDNDITPVTQEMLSSALVSTCNEITTVVFEWVPGLNGENDIFRVSSGVYFHDFIGVEVVFESMEIKSSWFYDGESMNKEISLTEYDLPSYIFGIGVYNRNTNLYDGNIILLSIDTSVGIKQSVQAFKAEVVNEGNILINFGWLSAATHASDGMNGNLRFISNRLATIGAVDCYQLGGTPADMNITYLDGQGNIETLK